MTKRQALLSPTFAFPMGAVVVLTIAFLIYFLAWTARRERALDGRAFRQLATASDQLRNRLDHYGISLRQVSKLASTEHAAYIRDRVAGLQWEDCRSVGPEVPAGESVRIDSQDLHLQFKDEKDQKRSVCAWAPVEASVTPFLEGSAEAFFDELVLTDQSGRVLYQTKKTGMRVAGLGQLRRAVEPTGGEAKTKDAKTKDDGGDSAVLGGAGALSSTLAKDVIAGRSYRFYVVPVPLALASASDSKASRVNLILAGLFEEGRFERERLSLPGTVMIGGGLTLAIVIVSAWPLLKFSTMRASELIPRRAGLYYVLLSLVTSALAILLIVQVGYLFHQGDTDQRLRELAVRVEENLGTEALKALGVLRGAASTSRFLEASTRYALCEAPSTNKEWRADVTRVLSLDGFNASEYPYLHRLIWTDGEGTQRVKWEAGERPTPRVDTQNRSYIRETLRGNLWQLAGHPEAGRFRIDPVYSNNTGEYLAVMAQPLSGDVCRGRPIVATAVTPLLSLIHPVLPADFGFVVVDQQGQVIFHSQAEKNGWENFFHEIDADASLRAATFARQKHSLSASYQGAEHRLYVTPLESIERCPWTLIVFRNLTPRRAQQLETILLFCCLTGGYYLLLVIVGLAVVRLPHYPGSWVWPLRMRSGEYYHLAIAQTIAALAVCGVIFTAEPVEVLASVLLIPGAALVFAYLKLRGREDEILLGAAVLWLAWLLAYLWNFRARGAANWTVLLFVTFALAAYVLVAWRRLTAMMARWRGLHVESSFALTGLTLVLVVGILPCAGFFRLAHDHYALMFTRREQLLTLEALREREDRVKRENAKFFLLPHEASKGLEETVKWVFLRRRLEDTALDRYDRIGAIDERELLIARGREESRPEPDGRMTRFLAWLTSAIPDNEGEELRRLLIAPGKESMWMWERSGDSLRLRPRRVDQAGSENSTLAALHKIAAADPVYLSPDLVSKVETLQLGSMPRGVAIPLVLLMAGMFFWIRSTTRQLFLLNRRFARPWDEFDPEKTKLQQNTILVGLPCSGRTAWLASQKCIYRIDTVELVRGADIPAEISETMVALDHFDYGTHPKAMQRKLEALEDLVLRRNKTVVIVTSSDPLYNLTGENDPEGSAADLAEGGDGERWARVLMSFKPMRLRTVQRPSSREYSRVLWSTCSRYERVALYQLARGGWANYKNWAALEHLWQRGLVERSPVVRIADKNIRDFVNDFVSPEEWKAWQRREGAALWDGLRLMFIVLIMGVGATALFMNQQQILAYIVTGISALTPVTKLLSELRITGKGESKG